jgi:hypothetical protein
MSAAAFVVSTTALRPQALAYDTRGLFAVASCSGKDMALAAIRGEELLLPREYAAQVQPTAED